MKQKIEYINIEGYDYPMSFSLYVASELSKRHSDKELKNISQENASDGIDIIIELLALLIQSGCGYLNTFRLFNPNRNFNFNANGEIQPLTKKELIFLINPTEENMQVIKQKIENCRNNGQQKAINARPMQGSKKNRR